MGYRYKIHRTRNVSKRKNLGGMLRNVYKIGKTVTKSTIGIGKDVGKDYLQTRTKKIIKDIYQDEDIDPSLLSDPDFLISGRKPPPSSRKIHLITATRKNNNLINRNNNKARLKLAGRSTTNKRKYKKNRIDKKHR